MDMPHTKHTDKPALVAAQHAGKDANTAGHESSEQIKQLAHHIVSNTPETDLPAVRKLLAQHPISKNVLHEWYQHYRGEALPPDEDDDGDTSN